MAKSVTAANKQIERLKKQLTEMKEAAAARAKARTASAATRRSLRVRTVSKRIAALKTAIAATQEAMKDATPKTAARMAQRIARMEKAIEKLQVDVRHLTVYNVRLLENEKVIGEFGPYATIRAASADAKNILRMHLGPSQVVEGKRINQIEEIGVDEPLMRSDGQVWVYFHPSIYSGQQSGGPVLTAQVVETGGKKERTDTFIIEKPDAKKPKKKKKVAASAQTSLLPNRRRVNRRRNPGPFASMAEIKAANAARGSHFFDRKTMAFFASKVEGGPYGGRFFVTSEKTGFTSTKRAYTVRRVSDDGTIRTVGSMGDFATKADAVAHARHLAGTE